jgi:hypothetical protein
MTSVWIVSHGERYEGSTIIGVFAKEKDAQMFALDKVKDYYLEGEFSYEEPNRYIAGVDYWIWNEYKIMEIIKDDPNS